MTVGNNFMIEENTFETGFEPLNKITPRVSQTKFQPTINK